MITTLWQNPRILIHFGLYTTTTLVESLFTLIIQSNSSNCVISLVVTIFRNYITELSATILELIYENNKYAVTDNNQPVYGEHQQTN